MQLIRAFQFYAMRRQAGANTLAAMRGMRARGFCRGQGGALNARKIAGLGFALLQFVVDHVQRLMCRADSCMLMKHARELRAQLLHQGSQPRDLPKLVGNAGHKWFERWRKMSGMSRKVTGMKLKVSWKREVEDSCLLGEYLPLACVLGNVPSRDAYAIHQCGPEAIIVQ